jgi:adenine-specific DNA-methyltransferase
LEITATFDSEFHIPQGGIYFGSPREKFNSKIGALLAVLNSRLLSSIYAVLFSGMHMGGGYLRYRTYFLESLPISERIFDSNSFILLANYILLLKKEGKDTTFFEHLIDSMVYELYFPDEIKAAGCEVLKYLASLPEVNDNWSNEQKLVAIEKSYKELSDLTHPVRIAMKKMLDIPEIRIIEGQTS